MPRGSGKPEQVVPFTAKAVGAASLVLKLPVKPMVTVVPVTMVPL